MVNCKVSRVKVGRDGYTSTGRYFGSGGQPVFSIEAWNDETGWHREEFVREPDYQTARDTCKARGWKVLA